jgi:type IV secretory pathway VirB10-like protein
MAEASEPKPATVVDQRPVPRGVIPRHAQMWLMVGLAVAILGIIVFAGQPEPIMPTSAPVAGVATEPDPARLRDFQDRLRGMDARIRQEQLQDVRQPAAGAVQAYGEPMSANAPEDPLDAERKRRDYESLFSSNIVMTRRPDGQQLITAGNRTGTRESLPDGGRVSGPPSVDEVADAVVRATSRYGVGAPQPESFPQTVSQPNAEALGLRGGRTRPAVTGPITSDGPLHRLVEGTIIDAILTNRLDGSVAAPVNCLVTNAVYSHDGQFVLVPAGSRVVGETKPVQAVGDSRLAVVFHRLVLPDGSSYALDQVTGLNQVGDAGLSDRVDRHYRSTFGASAAVGLISGLAQVFTGGAFGGDGNRTVVIAGGVGDATSQATAQTMNRYLNRLPTVTIREGHRVKVYLTADLELPSYGSQIHTTPAVRAADVVAGVRR